MFQSLPKTIKKPSSRKEEQRICMMLKSWLELEHKLAIVHIANEGKRSAQYGGTLKKMGMQKGFPDFHLPLMKRHYGALYMEVKVNRNSYISPEQRYWITYLKQQGYYADFCYGFDDGKAFIERYLAL